MGVADRQKLIADAGKKESWRKEEVKVRHTQHTLNIWFCIANAQLEQALCSVDTYNAH
jgi:hypothetical protein